MLNVFVYGTLMRGQRNHKNYLSQSEFIGCGEITGFAMYAVSSFPGIVPENGEKVKGEVYQVDQDTLRRLDSLEGEGSLYLRKPVDVLVEGKLLQAWIYVWNQEVKGMPKLDYGVQPWPGANKTIKLPVNKRYIWYASYGSNLLEERFMHYIQGGVCRFNGVEYRGCSDKSAPLEDRPCMINHELYFGNRSVTWEGGGVAFLNPTPNEHSDTWGRMFLITAEQFAEVQEQEGAWYDLVIDLGEADGIPIETFTNSKIVTKNDPSQNYIEIIRKGLHETYPENSEWEIEKYLVENGLYCGEKMLQALHFIRKSPRRCSVFEIMNMVRYKLEKAKRIIEPLVEKGYIKQDSRDTSGEYEPQQLTTQYRQNARRSTGY
ncbi:gamma-glutamylcyclotransferase [Desulfitobacterium sp. THU1]|uniref:gamma-glutamylcyclotransferase n=1 Tax=Desulfitobacterium sp. THU1 TaxID=3138072 RepID=UPI00311F376E